MSHTNGFGDQTSHHPGTPDHDGGTRPSGAPLSANGSPPLRPTAVVPLSERAASGLRLFGLVRLVLGAVSVSIVVVGLWWLLRAPELPVEQRLPVAGSTGAGATGTTDAGATLPVATSTPPTEVDDATPTVLTVHVVGHVAHPGVYQLGEGARVVDAIDAAGGASRDADPAGLNLAAPVTDGTRIYMPAVGEVDVAAIGAVGTPGDGGQVTDEAALTGPVNLNTAGVAELETLPGVGPATAAAIVDDRTRNGPFASIEDLDRVSGIGPAKLAALQDLVTT